MEGGEGWGGGRKFLCTRRSTDLLGVVGNNSSLAQRCSGGGGGV